MEHNAYVDRLIFATVRSSFFIDRERSLDGGASPEPFEADVMRSIPSRAISCFKLYHKGNSGRDSSRMLRKSRSRPNCLPKLVDYEKPSTSLCARPMRFHVVGNFVAVARVQRQDAAVAQFRIQLTIEDQQDVPLRTPMVGLVAGCVLDHS